MSQSVASAQSSAARPSHRRFRLPRPRIGFITLCVNLLVLAMPVAGFLALRIYESALVRQTENALVGQAAFIAAVAQSDLAEILTETDSLRETETLPFDLEVPSDFDPVGSRWLARAAALDLATARIFPPSDPPLMAEREVSPLMADLAEKLPPILHDAAATTLSAMWVTDFSGRVIASTEVNASDAVLISNWTEVHSALRGQRVSLLRQRSAEPQDFWTSLFARNESFRVHFAMPIVVDNRIAGTVVLWRTPPSIAQLLAGKQRELIFGGLFLLLFVFAMSRFTEYAIRRPVRRLEQQALDAASARVPIVEPLTHPVTQEVANLSEALSILSESLNERASYIRDLAARISHEFKSPLTSMHGAIELMLDHEDMEPTRRARFLTNIDSDRARLQALVERLLELARADAPSARVKEQQPLSRIIDRTAERFQGEGLETDVSLRPDLFVEKDMFESILNNLIDNAVLHGADVPDIRLTAQQTRLSDSEDRIAVTVENTGPHISDANMAKIFDPFFTTARTEGGTGLGLSVVQSLVLGLDGQLEVQNTADGVRVSLIFTVARHDNKDIQPSPA